MLDTIMQEMEMENMDMTGSQIFTFEEEKEMKTVLIVEDDELIRRSVSRIIASKGFKVIEAENGEVGLAKFREEHPALILTDIRMPVMDGFELLENVKLESPQTPVIIFSGVGTKPDIIAALRAGAWDYIMKPIEDMNYLLDTIDQVLTQAEMSYGYTDVMERALKNKNDELETELKKRKILELQLMHAKKEWEKTVDSIVEAIALVDSNSLLIRVNNAMAELLGDKPSEVIGKEHYLSTNGFNNKKQGMADHTALLRGKHLTGKFSSEDGSKVYDISMSPYYDYDDKTVIGAVYVARDITGR